MLKKTVTYVDYNGIERTEDFYFNLTKAELTYMNMAEYGALEDRLKKIVNAKSAPEIMENFRSLLRKSYGEISSDGRRFIKSEELSDAFEQTEAYSQIFMELCTDPKASAAFASGIIPKDLADAVEEERKKQETAEKSKIVAMSAPETD